MTRRIFSVMIFNRFSDESCYLLCRYDDLSSIFFLARSQFSELLLHLNRQLILATSPGLRQSVTLDREGIREHVRAHCFSTRMKLAGVIITDIEYPPRVAHQLLNKLLNEAFNLWEMDLPNVDVDYSLPSLDNLLTKYDNPEEFDSALRLEREVDETRKILLLTVDQLMLRGEKIEDLAGKTKDLKYQSRVFHKNAKEMKPCCLIS